MSDEGLAVVVHHAGDRTVHHRHGCDHGRRMKHTYYIIFNKGEWHARVAGRIEEGVAKTPVKALKLLRKSIKQQGKS